jgi:hypothetical protein
MEVSVAVLLPNDRRENTPSPFLHASLSSVDKSRMHRGGRGAPAPPLLPGRGGGGAPAAPDPRSYRERWIPWRRPAWMQATGGADAGSDRIQVVASSMRRGSLQWRGGVVGGRGKGANILLPPWTRSPSWISPCRRRWPRRSRLAPPAYPCVVVSIMPAASNAPGYNGRCNCCWHKASSRPMYPPQPSLLESTRRCTRRR